MMSLKTPNVCIVQERESIMTCPVCCSAFTVARRTPVTCAHCEFAACQECYRAYVVSSVQDPHCMSCRRAWPRDVIMQTFPATWLNGDFKKHRETVLVERERQLLPETQELVPTYREVQSLRAALPSKMQRLETLKNEWRRLSHDASRFRAARLEQHILHGDDQASGSSSRTQRRGFSCPCPVDTCRGFMDVGMLCGVCGATACNACGVLLGAQDHECDPDIKKNFDTIKKQTRPCPKCAVPTFKISGCNQMWCTSCHTAWDWESGNVVRSVIHNPHYFQYLRDRSTTGEIPRQQGDGDGEQEIRCNEGRNWPSGQLVARRMGELFSTAQRVRCDEYRTVFAEITSLQRQLVHLSEVEIPALQYRYRNTDNLDLRLKYLTNELSREDFKMMLQRREKKREKDLAAREIYEVLVNVGRDTLWAFIEARLSHLQAADELRNIAIYANQHLSNISTQYKMKVRTIRLSPRTEAAVSEGASGSGSGPATKRSRS